MVAQLAWVRADVPGFDNVSVFKEILHFFAVTSAASAKVEMESQVSACILGNWEVKLPMAGESRHSHKNKMCLLENAKAVAAWNMSRIKFYVSLSSWCYVTKNWFFEGVLGK